MITRKPPTIWKKILDRSLEILKKIYKYIIAIGIICLIAYLLTHLSFFNITKLNVTKSEGKELEYVKKEYIQDRFNNQKNKNYFQYNLKTLEHDIKKENSFIEQVFASKAFPNQLDIVVKERIPKLVLNNQSKCILLADSGFTLDIQEQVEGKCYLVYTYPGLVVVNDPDFLGDFKVNVQSPFYIVDDIVNIVSVYNFYGLVIQSCDIKENVMTCLTQKNITVIFSMAQDIKEQLIRSVAMLEQLNKQVGDIKSIDVRYKRPVIQEK